MVATFLLAAAAGVSPVPPPVEQEFADCEHPVYASDQLVCEDEALLALDEEMRSLLPMTPTPALTQFESQGAWFKRSRMCAFRADQPACLTGAYRERILLLRAAHTFTATGDAWLPFLCRKKEVASIAPAGDGVYAIRYRDGVLLAVSGSSVEAWKPWVGWTQPKPNRLEISGASDIKLNCYAPTIEH